MRAYVLILVALWFTITVAVAQQGPLPARKRGPHEGEAGAVCYPGQTRSVGQGRTLYHCECVFKCEMGAGGEPIQREDDDCVTACGTNQCSCHPEEACPMESKS